MAVLSEQPAIDFALKVIEMRRQQREYFRTRDRDVLMVSKRLEKEVDAIIAKMLAVEEQEQEGFDLG